MIAVVQALTNKAPLFLGFSVSSWVFIAGLLLIAIMLSRIPGSWAWWNGLLGGLGLCLPLPVVVLLAIHGQPDHAATTKLTGWIICGFALLVAAAGTQSIAFLWCRRWVAASLVILGALAVLLVGRQIAERSLSQPSIHAQVDKPLPNLMLTRLDGSSIPQSDLQGRITVIDFWGTWCPGCVAELPALNDVSAEYAANPTVKFLLVNSELNGDDQKGIAGFLHRRPSSIPAVLDPEQSYYKLGISELPLLLVVDQRGHIRYEDTGYESAGQTTRRLHSEIETLLAAK